MNYGTIVFGGGGFAGGFIVGKIAGKDNGTCTWIGLGVGLLGAGVFNFIIAPKVIGDLNATVAQANQDYIKNLNQAQADDLAARVKAAETGNPRTASDLFDRQKFIDVLTAAKYSYKDGKAIKV